jgi:flagellin
MTIETVNMGSGPQNVLNTIHQTSSLMSETSNRLATGLAVNAAIDSPDRFFSAMQNNNQASDLMSMKDTMSEAVYTIKAADNGIDAIKDLMSTAKSIADSARSISGQDAESRQQRSELADQFKEVLNQVAAIAQDSGYGGVNLLKGSNLAVSLNKDEEAIIEIEGFDANTSAGSDLAISVENNWASESDVDVSISDINSAVNTLRTKSGSLSSKLSTITTRDNFTKGAIHNLKEGAENLTEADLNEEAAKILALKMQQQLSTGALKVSSQAVQSVLSFL